MKQKIIPLMLTALAALAIAACEDDEAIINPDPGAPSTVPDATADTKAILSSEYCPNSDIVLFNIGDPDSENLAPDDLGRADKIQLKLKAPLDKDITLRIGMEDDYANNVLMANGGSYASLVTINFKKEHNLTTSFSDNIEGLINNIIINESTEAFVTIKAGELQSEPIDIFFLRKSLREQESYLFPIQATDISTGELYAQTYYVVSFKNEKIIGQRPAVFIAYVDTEVMNPLIADKFSYELATDDYNTGEHTVIYFGPYFEILNIRTATIEQEAGRPTISLTADLEYVLKNRAQYLMPMQKNGLKICLCIKGGGTGLGFSNLTDEQTSDFVAKAKVLVDMYELDGINLWDEGASYEKDGAAPINAESYAKLIKALKTAMPDKLLTMVDTRETTEALCDPVAGISVGDYLDYAWSSLEDYLAPYEPGATLRPLANVDEKRYATIFMRDMAMIPDEEQMAMMENPIVGDYLNMIRFDPLSATDVLVIYDIPYMDYGKEGVWNFGMIWEAAKYPAPEDFSSFTMGSTTCPKFMHDYYMFKKDW